MCNTNNGTERINEELKYEDEDLDRCVNSNLNELMLLIVDEFLPRRYERYVEMNVQYSSGHKSYQPGIPKYMWNRPATIVGDLLDKLGKVSPKMVKSVQRTNLCCKVYSVQGESTVSSELCTYTVDFGDEETYVSCSCPWYRRNRSLCKHFFACMKSGLVEFGDLSPLYLHHPLHILDEELFASKDDIPCTSSKVTTCPSSLSPFTSDSQDVQADLFDDIYSSDSEDSPQEIIIEEAIKYEELQPRTKSSKLKKMSLLANLKHLTELCYNISHTENNLIDVLDEKTNIMIHLVSGHLRPDDENLIKRPQSPKRMLNNKTPKVRHASLTKRAKNIHTLVGLV